MELIWKYPEIAQIQVHFTHFCTCDVSNIEMREEGETASEVDFAGVLGGKLGGTGGSKYRLVVWMEGALNMDTYAS